MSEVEELAAEITELKSALSKKDEEIERLEGLLDKFRSLLKQVTELYDRDRFAMTGEAIFNKDSDKYNGLAAIWKEDGENTERKDQGQDFRTDIERKREDSKLKYERNFNMVQTLIDNAQELKRDGILPEDLDTEDPAQVSAWALSHKRELNFDFKDKIEQLQK